MEFKAWKAALISEIEIAAESRAETAQGVADDPRLAASQKALFDLAEGLRRLSADHAPLIALFNEETELANVMRAPVDEPENRYHEAKEALLQAYGLDQEPFESIDHFLATLRDSVDETISEYRLRA